VLNYLNEFLESFVCDVLAFLDVDVNCGEVSIEFGGDVLGELDEIIVGVEVHGVAVDGNFFEEVFIF
jgi:hypothetical protein